MRGDYKDCSGNAEACGAGEFCRTWWFDLDNSTFALCCPKPSACSLSLSQVHKIVKRLCGKAGRTTRASARRWGWACWWAWGRSPCRPMRTGWRTRPPTSRCPATSSRRPWPSPSGTPPLRRGPGSPSGSARPAPPASSTPSASTRASAAPSLPPSRLPRVQTPPPPSSSSPQLSV